MSPMGNIATILITTMGNYSMAEKGKLGQKRYFKATFIRINLSKAIKMRNCPENLSSSKVVCINIVISDLDQKQTKTHHSQNYQYAK